MKWGRLALLFVALAIAAFGTCQSTALTDAQKKTLCEAVDGPKLDIHTNSFPFVAYVSADGTAHYATRAKYEELAKKPLDKLSLDELRILMSKPDDVPCAATIAELATKGLAALEGKPDTPENALHRIKFLMRLSKFDEACKAADKLAESNSKVASAIIARSQAYAIRGHNWTLEADKAGALGETNQAVEYLTKALKDAVDAQNFLAGAPKNIQIPYAQYDEFLSCLQTLKGIHTYARNTGRTKPEDSQVAIKSLSDTQLDAIDTLLGSAQRIEDVSNVHLSLLTIAADLSYPITDSYEPLKEGMKAMLPTVRKSVKPVDALAQKAGADTDPYAKQSFFALRFFLHSWVGDEKSALDELCTVLKNNPDFHDLPRIVLSLSFSDHRDDFLARAKRLLAVRDDYVSRSLLFADAASKEDMTTATLHLEAMLRLEPNDAWSHVAFAKVLLLQDNNKNLAKAKEHLSLAEKLLNKKDDKNVKAAYCAYLGVTRALEGNMTSARAAFKSAKTLDPEHGGIDEALEMIGAK